MGRQQKGKSSNKQHLAPLWSSISWCIIKFPRSHHARFPPPTERPDWNSTSSTISDCIKSHPERTNTGTFRRMVSGKMGPTLLKKKQATSEIERSLLMLIVCLINCEYLHKAFSPPVTPDSPVEKEWEPWRIKFTLHFTRCARGRLVGRKVGRTCAYLLATSVER